MKRTNRFVTFLFVLTGALLLQVWSVTAQTGGAGPRAVVPEPVKDMGSVRLGDLVEHDFMIRNEGKTVLMIEGVDPACGCVVASFDKTVAPGEIGKVHVTFNTSSFTGPVAKGVTVYTNDPSNPQIELTIRAKIVPFFDVKPGYARFIVVQGEANESGIDEHIAATDGSSFQIIKAESPMKGMTVSFREAAPNERRPGFTGKQWIVRIELSPDIAVGQLEDFVEIKTDSPQQPLIQIPISGFVRPVIAVTPPFADFGKIQLTGQLRKTLTIRAFSTERIAVTSAESTVKNIDVKLEPVAAGREYLVRITIDPAIAKGPFSGKIVIHTDSKKAQLIEVQIHGVVL